MLLLHALGACGCGGVVPSAAAAVAAARNGGAAALLLAARRGLASAAGPPDARGGAKGTTAAPVMPDRAGASETVGRSSQVASVKVLTDDRLLAVVDDVFAVGRGAPKP